MQAGPRAARLGASTRAPSRARSIGRCADHRARYALLTAKPSLYVANVDEGVARRCSKNPHFVASRGACQSERAPGRPHLRALEAQIAELDAADRPEFLASAGLKEPGLSTRDPRRLRAARPHHLLHGRQAGSPRLDHHARHARPQAAGVIHTDFEKGFIRAEVIWWEDFVSSAARPSAARRASSRSKARSTSCATAT